MKHFPRILFVVLVIAGLTTLFVPFSSAVMAWLVPVLVIGSILDASLLLMQARKR